MGREGSVKSPTIRPVAMAADGKKSFAFLILIKIKSAITVARIVAGTLSNAWREKFAKRFRRYIKKRKIDS
ncbi:MAG: hypothetical protein UU52_C0019G0013 [Candidatus Levybacteria bacterium GW2011_GWB1_41_21]|nr:MAG: hypothetical protein UT46_C0003G0044 [Candidatus Levybacteria bacterium GW2011_GWA1_39_34]KKS01074.1 MAG: hypothetical protein UU52_C0019G0013 [Candidatus Levybacteria bacterium GW2011_GWB1_41_21]